MKIFVTQKMVLLVSSRSCSDPFVGISLRPSCTPQLLTGNCADGFRRPTTRRRIIDNNFIASIVNNDVVVRSTTNCSARNVIVYRSRNHDFIVDQGTPRRIRFVLCINFIGNGHRRVVGTRSLISPK